MFLVDFSLYSPFVFILFIFATFWREQPDGQNCCQFAPIFKFVMTFRDNLQHILPCCSTVIVQLLMSRNNLLFSVNSLDILPCYYLIVSLW